jgi:glycosyltransferase involved in cell wall biosynthesis
VGIPTYERAQKLRRAIESVLAQTHRNLELIVCDNASRDGTRELSEELRGRDARLRYVRFGENRGPTANFNAVFAGLSGEYVMVLSDDDWLDADYVAECLAELRAREGTALVCGTARYVRDGNEVGTGVAMQLTDASAARRVLCYLREVDENGVFYGLMPREVLRRAAPLRNVLGNDWLLAAAVAAQGEVATLPGTFINRELGGTSADIPTLLRTLGLPRWQAFVPHLVIAWELIAEIGWRGTVFRQMPLATRARLAPSAAWRAIDWRSLAWHIATPAFAAVGRRPGGRWLWHAYQRFIRGLGAGGSG